MKNSALFLCCLSVLFLAGCGALTGIPGHGGGKRFAIEQELISAATRSAVKQLDLEALRGKNVNLYVSAIGDTGAGNITGGKLSFVSQLQGTYTQAPKVKETYVYPRYESNSTVKTSSSSDTNSSSDSTESTSSTKTSTTQTSTSSTLLNAPTSTTSQEKGAGVTVEVGAKYEGLGAYHNSEEFDSSDLLYLNAVLQSYLFLEGVNIVPPSEADIDVYITVDVFGTVYTRVDWIIANNEILKAKTSMEIFAVKNDNGKVVMKPQTVSAEAEYNEQYILWTGPVYIYKKVNMSEPLLTDFMDVSPGEKGKLQNKREVIPERPFADR